MCDLMVLYIDQDIWTRAYFPFGITDLMFFSVVIQDSKLAEIVLSKRLDLLDSPLAKDHAEELLNLVLGQSDILNFEPGFAKLTELAATLPEVSILEDLKARICQIGKSQNHVESIDCDSLF
jgi:hypothetical protein